MRYRRGRAGHNGRGNAVGFLGAAVGRALLAVAGTQREDREASGEQCELFHNLYKTRLGVARLGSKYTQGKQYQAINRQRRN